MVGFLAKGMSCLHAVGLIHYQKYWEELIVGICPLISLELVRYSSREQAACSQCSRGWALESTFYP